VTKGRSVDNGQLAAVAAAGVAYFDSPFDFEADDSVEELDDSVEVLDFFLSPLEELALDAALLSVR
jgi:hypothetical protein